MFSGRCPDYPVEMCCCMTLVKVDKEYTIPKAGFIHPLNAIEWKMKVTILAKLQVIHEWLSNKITFHILYLLDLSMNP